MKLGWMEKSYIENECIESIAELIGLKVGLLTPMPSNARTDRYDYTVKYTATMTTTQLLFIVTAFINNNHSNLGLKPFRQ